MTGQDENMTRRGSLKRPKMDPTKKEAILKLIDEARQTVKPTVRAERVAEEVPEAVALLRFK